MQCSLRLNPFPCAWPLWFGRSCAPMTDDCGGECPVEYGSPYSAGCVVNLAKINALPRSRGLSDQPLQGRAVCGVTSGSDPIACLTLAIPPLNPRSRRPKHGAVRPSTRLQQRSCTRWLVSVDNLTTAIVLSFTDDNTLPQPAFVEFRVVDASIWLKGQYPQDWMCFEPATSGHPQIPRSTTVDWAAMCRVPLTPATADYRVRHAHGDQNLHLIPTTARRQRTD